VMKNRRVRDADIPRNILKPNRVGASLGKEPLSGIQDFLPSHFGASAAAGSPLG